MRFIHKMQTFPSNAQSQHTHFLFGVAAKFAFHAKKDHSQWENEHKNEYHVSISLFKSNDVFLVIPFNVNVNRIITAEKYGKLIARNVRHCKYLLELWQMDEPIKIYCVWEIQTKREWKTRSQRAQWTEHILTFFVATLTKFI